jgi:hypothetical protein
MSQEQQENKESSGREIKLTPVSNTYLNITSQESSFERVFLRAAPGVHKVLDGFLSYRSLLNLVQINKRHRKIYSPSSIAIKALTEVIGPDPKLLIDENESATDAFKRQRQQTKKLKQRATNIQLMAENLSNNPNYYFSAIAHHSSFLHFDGAIGYQIFLNIIARYPVANQLFQHIFAYFNNELIVPIFSNIERFLDTIKRNPELKDLFIKHAITSKKTIFLSHGFTFLELMLTHSKVKDEYPEAHLILIDLLQEIPESAGLFMPAVISDDNLFRIIFPKRKIIDAFNKVFPQYKQIILTVFKNLPNARIKFESKQNPSSLFSIPEFKFILKQARMPLLSSPPYFQKFLQNHYKYPELIKNLSEFLDADATLSLSRTCKTFYAVYSDLYAKKLLLENIGPDFVVLTKEIKSHVQAYKHHRIIQQQWKPVTKITTFEELSNLLNKISAASYYIGSFIKPNEFRDFFYNPLTGNLSLLNFLKSYPEHLPIIFQYLSNELPLEDFNRMFRDGPNFLKLCAEYPIFIPCLFKKAPYGKAHFNFTEYYFSTLQQNEDGSYQPTFDTFLTILKFLPEHLTFICESVIANERLFNIVFSSIQNIRIFSDRYPQYQPTLQTLFQLYTYDKSPKIKRTSHSYIAQLLFNQQINPSTLDLVPIPPSAKSELIHESQNLIQLLEPNDCLRVSLTNSNNRKLFYDLRYIRLIQDQIGPNPQPFIEANKTPFIAYHRHRRFLSGLRVMEVKTTDELGERISKYPGYHLNQLVYFLDIRKILLPDSTEAVPYSKYLAFVKKYKHHQRSLIDYLCKDAYFFTRIILNHNHLIRLTAALPRFEENIIKAFLSDNIFLRENKFGKYFRDIIPNIDAIINLVNAFPTKAHLFIPILVNKSISGYFLRDLPELIKLIKFMDPATTKKVVTILLTKNNMISYIYVGNEEDQLIELLKALYQLYDNEDEFIQKILKHPQFNNFLNLLYRYFKSKIQPEGSLLIDAIIAKPSEFLKQSDSFLKESKPELKFTSIETSFVYSSSPISNSLFFRQPPSLDSSSLTMNEHVENSNIDPSGADLSSCAETVLYEMD